MALYYKNVAVLAKTEVTYNTDPVPTGAANAILTKGAVPQPLLGNRVTRDLDRSTWGAQSEINTGPYVTVAFSVEIAGGGAAGTGRRGGMTPVGLVTRPAPEPAAQGRRSQR